MGNSMWHADEYQTRELFMFYRKMDKKKKKM